MVRRAAKAEARVLALEAQLSGDAAGLATTYEAILDSGDAERIKSALSDAIADIRQLHGEKQKAEAQVAGMEALLPTLNREYHRADCASNVFGPFASCCKPPHSREESLRAQVAALVEALRRMDDYGCCNPTVCGQCMACFAHAALVANADAIAAAEAHDRATAQRALESAKCGACGGKVVV